MPAWNSIGPGGRRGGEWTDPRCFVWKVNLGFGVGLFSGPRHEIPETTKRRTIDGTHAHVPVRRD